MAKALNPVVRQTPGERYIAEMKRRTEEAKRTNSVVNSDMPADIRQDIEQDIRRQLTGPEILRRKLHREDTRTPSEKIAAEKWQVVMEAAAQEVPYAKEMREAEEIVAREKRALMTPAERRAALIKDLSEKKIAEAAGQVASQKRMADPAVVSALATLQALKNRAAFDPNWSYAEVEALERAERQLTTPGSDLKVGIEMTRAAVGILTSKQQAAADGIMAQRAALEAQLAELSASAIDYLNVGKYDGNHAAVQAYYDDGFAQLPLDEMKAREAAYNAYCASCDPGSVPAATPAATASVGAP